MPRSSRSSGTTRDTLGRTVEFAHAVYRGDRYRITSHLRFDTTSG
ncbi:hypothetical protein [Streptacidiphilus sp. PAMC 29251]